jgi:predicted nucleic acid-binding protein
MIVVMPLSSHFIIAEIYTLMLRKIGRDFSYVDATSFAVMERLGIRDAFAFDGHFEQYSLNRLPE